MAPASYCDVGDVQRAIDVTFPEEHALDPEGNPRPGSVSVKEVQKAIQARSENVRKLLQSAGHKLPDELPTGVVQVARSIVSESVACDLGSTMSGVDDGFVENLKAHSDSNLSALTAKGFTFPDVERTEVKQEEKPAKPKG